ncbi:hypothetical protein ACFQ3J_14495 [Paenibacillus provencensis]|uniref:Uncharacterized protein n=1 Tax=Paenibacillus provencensis TaxID=441151 RepID=A0ABW3PWU6_9BACL|nr:hypothetical protein [Paenibacillus sp. MER 78]MCM3127843.1 hypothetical protein [Paenibacillus sp. MER 78]
MFFTPKHSPNTQECPASSHAGLLHAAPSQSKMRKGRAWAGSPCGGSEKYSGEALAFVFVREWLPLLTLQSYAITGQERSDDTFAHAATMSQPTSSILRSITITPRVSGFFTRRTSPCCPFPIEDEEGTGLGWLPLRRERKVIGRSISVRICTGMASLLPLQFYAIPGQERSTILSQTQHP